VNKNAQTLSKTELINKFKTLSQGKISESVLDKLAMTFIALVKHADFNARSETTATRADAPEVIEDEQVEVVRPAPSGTLGISKSLGGLHYNIQIILPESRDPKVYDALFRSLREHLLS
jgi:hypothetical protein